MVTLSNLNPFAPTVKVTTEITELRIYPIKSCRGISVPSTRLTKRGLDLDRRWMFVDALTRKFLTIRDIPEMTLIDTALASSLIPAPANGAEDDLHLVISIRDHPDKRVRVPARPTPGWLAKNTMLESVEIWGQETDGYIYGDEINAPFTDFFHKPVALVFKGPTPRICGGNAAPQHLGREESTHFPDVMPLQIASEESLKELNGRLRAKGQGEITIERFRPNIVVRGGEEVGMPAWSEDAWKTVRIVGADSPISPATDQAFKPGISSWSGMLSSIVSTATSSTSAPPTLDIDVAARCARCQVPNVEPETAVKDKHEPWDTLVSYRRVDEGIKWKPCFGMLSVPRSEGDVKVGMQLEVVETTEDHLYVKGF